MKLEEKHHNAASSLANGGTEAMAAQAAGVSPSTISRWKRDGSFRDLIDHYREPMKRAIASTANPDHLEVYSSIPVREADLVERLEQMLERLSGIVLNKLENLDETDIEEMPARLIPNFFRAFTDGLSLLQEIHDRESGYDLVVAELGKLIEEKPDHSQN